MKNYLLTILLIWYFILFFYAKENILIVNDFLKNEYFLYCISFLNAIFWWIFFISIIWILEKSIEKIVSKIKNKLVWDLVLNFLKVSKYIIAVYIWLKIALIPENYYVFINQIFKVSFIVTIIILLNSFIETIFEWIKKSENYEINKHVIKLVKKVATIFIWLVWIITIIWNLGYDITALITWAWIWGLALALASQKSVANIFWALSLILNRPFKIWDSIKIWWVSWTVKDIWIMYLKITESSWHEINIPNESIITSPIENYSIRKWRKVDFTLNIKNEVDKIEKWLWIITEILETYKWENKIKSFRFSIDSISESSASIVWTFFSNNSELEASNKLKESLLIEILKRFREEEIWVV